MTVKQLIELLQTNHGAALHLRLPSGEFVPDHFHITEVGRIQKTFIDCGGTRRESVTCLLQAWTAHDLQHRLTAGKLLKIFALAEPVLGSFDLAVEVEYGTDTASQYVVAEVRVAPEGLLFALAGKQTDCLAPDKCGVSQCDSSGCCG